MATRAFSIEDGNLSSSILTSRDVSYKDVDLSFTTNTRKDVYKKTDAAAVKQAVKNLILTHRGEKPFSPYFGTKIRDMLFDLAYSGMTYDIQERIKVAINNFEPRAYVQSVKAKVLEDQNTIDVQVVFLILNSQESVTLNTSISRLR